MKQIVINKPWTMRYIAVVVTLSFLVELIDLVSSHG